MCNICVKNKNLNGSLREAAKTKEKLLMAVSLRPHPPLPPSRLMAVGTFFLNKRKC